jgi:hypothetical protein
MRPRPIAADSQHLPSTPVNSSPHGNSQSVT